MTNQVDHYARREPADRYHPEYESFVEWLDAEAPPDQAPKMRNRPRHWNRNAVTLDALAARR